MDKTIKYKKWANKILEVYMGEYFYILNEKT